MLLGIVLDNWVYVLVVLGVWGAGVIHGHVLTDELRRRGKTWKLTR